MFTIIIVEPHLQRDWRRRRARATRGSRRNLQQARALREQPAERHRDLSIIINTRLVYEEGLKSEILFSSCLSGSYESKFKSKIHVCSYMNFTLVFTVVLEKIDAEVLNRFKYQIRIHIRIQISLIYILQKI